MGGQVCESPISLGFNEAPMIYGFMVHSQGSEYPRGKSRALLSSES